MRLDDLLKPISPDAPCGEDLLAVDDPDFIDYYFNVEDRLPTSYFNMLRGTLFDPKSVDIKAETAQLDGLLARSRDLRLLALEAKFQILAGRFKQFADAVLGVAGLLQAYPAEVHPVDAVDRRNAIEELDALSTIAAPLEYAPLFTDKRSGEILYRPYGTGAGKLTLREGEVAGDHSNILAKIGASENIATVDALFAQITALRAALVTITEVCQAGTSPFTPRLGKLEERLSGIEDMILAARSDLGATIAVAEVGKDGAAVEGGVAGAGSALTFTVAATPDGLPNHRAAFRLLMTVETYFATNEPASLALILVTQSRLLIGRPLVEALDALMESTSGYAALSFGAETGFQLSMSKMRDLSGYAAIASSDEWQQPQEGDPEPVVIVSRDHAGQVLKTVEEFFRIREPASPIPILLFKARNMLAKDFHQLVTELLPPPNG